MRTIFTIIILVTGILSTAAQTNKSYVRFSNLEIEEVLDRDSNVAELYMRFIISDPRDIQLLQLDFKKYGENQEEFTEEHIMLELFSKGNDRYVNSDGNHYLIENNRVEIVVSLTPYEVGTKIELLLSGIDVHDNMTNELSFGNFENYQAN